MALAATFGNGYSSAAPSETQVGIRRRLYVPASTAPPVLWLHSAGAGGVGTASLEPWLASNNCIPILEALTGLGLPVLAADCSGSGHWGNDTAQSRLTDMRLFAQSDGNLKASSGRVILIGTSMGGLLALNWTRANPTLVAAVVLFYPVVNLQAMHDGTGGASATAAGTEAAYGGSLSAFNAAVTAHDPAQNAAAYAGVPMKMWRSDSDNVAGSQNQASFYTAVGGSAFQQVVLPGAAHADMTRIDPASVRAFVSRYI